jgi:uncharacterized membrane protein YsdA (DUF1294 family)
MKLLISYIIIINLMMILLYGIDKYKAIHHHWRVSEKILLIGALFGGSLGAILAMYGFNHKTRKNIFKYGIPLLLGLQIILIIKTSIG